VRGEDFCFKLGLKPTLSGIDQAVQIHEHTARFDLFRKPVSAFPDHALMAPTVLCLRPEADFARVDARSLIGQRELARMKASAVLIQASRGGIVDEAALAAALAAGRIHGAAIDVYSTEPPSADNPLLMLEGEAAERLLLTPHIAGVTRQASARLFRAAWDNVERVLLRNEAPHHRVF
jgi:phosphoglycerate dehydrogenase-like enzyme